MGKKVNTKKHTCIGSNRSLCGKLPQPDDESIVPFSEFFAIPAEDQCGICVANIKRRGYNIEKERTKYRAIHHHAQQLSQQLAICA